LEKYPLQLGSSSWADMFMRGTWAAWYNIRVAASFLFFMRGYLGH